MQCTANQANYKNVVKEHTSIILGSSCKYIGNGIVNSMEKLTNNTALSRTVSENIGLTCRHPHQRPVYMSSAGSVGSAPENIEHNHHAAHVSINLSPKFSCTEM